MHQQLKHTSCPHCRAIGTLILHGWLYGYAENDECRKVQRGRRIFCNNRKSRNNGCGRTFTVWSADTLRRMRLSAKSLWRFLMMVISLGNKAKARRLADIEISISSAYRVWKRFLNRQSHLRTSLSRWCAPPQSQARQPVEKTLAHLRVTFPDTLCPIRTFQHRLQIAFL